MHHLFIIPAHRSQRTTKPTRDREKRAQLANNNKKSHQVCNEIECVVKSAADIRCVKWASSGQTGHNRSFVSFRAVVDWPKSLFATELIQFAISSRTATSSTRFSMAALWPENATAKANRFVLKLCGNKSPPLLSRWCCCIHASHCVCADKIYVNAQNNSLSMNWFLVCARRL